MKPLPHVPVDAQRPGYAVYSDTRDLFACEPEHAAPGTEQVTRGMWLGWCGPRGEVRVWARESDARRTAEALGCSVTTVPRWNGHVVTWDHVKEGG